MTRGVTRRRFIGDGAAIGATLGLGSGLLSVFAETIGSNDTGTPGVVAVTGPDGFDNTVAAVTALGGAAAFISSGTSVLINANTAFKHRGSIVSPEVLLAAIELCADAGARDMWLVKPVQDDYWARCERAAARSSLIDSVRVSEREFAVVDVDRGLTLKQAHIDRRLLSADVVLNIAIAKNHRGCDFTGTLKNTMGACPHDPTCRFFHLGSRPDSDEWYPDLDHLSQCVADLNTIRPPDLCILDAGEILVTNGPFGPGRLAEPRSVVASTDSVAIDAYGVRFLGLEPKQVGMIGRSEKHGLGTANLDAVGVRELSLA
jgi:uncharacterized protein (DUF362 family)